MLRVDLDVKMSWRHMSCALCSRNTVELEIV